MRNILLISILLIINFSSFLFSSPLQVITVKGYVTNKSNSPLPGVSVFIKGSTQGTITDIDGYYQIDIEQVNSILVFSFLGMKIEEFEIKESRTLDVVLTEESQAIEEIVITGYQKVDKRTFTGSVSKIESGKIKDGGIADVSRMLQGTLAGVAVENVSGTFGTKSKIRIRGNSSISGNQEPVWVIDGIVLDDAVDIDPNEHYTGNPATMISSSISGLNPYDIENIQVLKDAAATAMYGTQAVNGVIVVTTKRGLKDVFSVEYNSTLTLSLKPNVTKFNIMNSKERMEFSEEMYAKNLMDFTYLNEAYGAYGLLLSNLSKKEISWDEFDQQLRRYKTFNTDWFDVLFRNSVNQQHSLSIMSGNECSQYYTSVSYFNDNGYTIGQSVKRYTANFRSNHQINNRLNISTILSGSVRDQKSFGAFEQSEDNGVVTRDFDINPYSYARNTSRAMRPFDDNGNYEYYLKNFAPFNVLEEIENNFLKIDANDFKLQVDLDLKLTKNISYSGIFSGRYTTSYMEHIATEESNVAKSYRAMDSEDVIYSNSMLYDDPDDEDQKPISVLPRGGLLITKNILGNFYTARNSVNWKPSFNGLHFFDILAGTEFRQKKYRNYEFLGYGYEYYKGMTSSPDYRAIKRDMLVDGDPYFKTPHKNYYDFAMFTNIAYSYLSKYNATFSVRSDGSNRLGKSQRFKYLPIWVVGASWNIDQELFMQNLKFVDMLKLRGSYGLRGNVGGLGSPSLLAYYGLTSRFDGDDNENILDILSPENPGLQWEKERMASIGLDFFLFKRLSGTIEVYYRYNFDLIGNIEVPRESGFQSKNVNWADMTNKGIEITLDHVNISGKNFQWITMLSFGYNKNKIINALFTPTVMEATTQEGTATVGRPVKGLYSFRFAGLNSEGLPLFYDENNEKSMGTSTYSRDMQMLKYEGSREPLGDGGITNEFGYKNFKLSVLFTFKYGNKIRLAPIYSYYYTDVNALDKDLANRWQAPGDEQYTTIPRIIDNITAEILLSNNADPVTFYNRSDLRVADGSFIRLKSISLDYTVNNSILSKAKINSAVIKLQAQNLMLFADPKLNGQDPEYVTSGINVPQATTFSFGMSLTF